jgi:capsular polysaccharide transport system permease protein
MQLRYDASQHDTIVLKAVDTVPVTAAPAAQAMGSIGRALRWPIINLGYCLVVVVPTLISILYFAFIAADRYEVETKFVIRSQSNAAASQLASMMQGSSIIRSADDAYVVHAYIGSRDVIRRLMTSSTLLERLGRPEADFWWRYPGLWQRPNSERLYQHMKRLVVVDYDHSTGISTLRVQAFRADDARAIADDLLSESELLINRLSKRAQADSILTAERDVETGRVAAREIQSQITAFRNRVGMIDPGRVSTGALETILRLTLEAALTNAQIAEVEKAAPNSPQAGSLRQRVIALEGQVRKERERLAGDDASLAPLIAEYERLLLERELAEKTFASALTLLEAARADSQRQGLFLERISSPIPPDHPRYPYGLLGILATLAVTSIVYSIGRNLISDTMMHAEK